MTERYTLAEIDAINRGGTDLDPHPVAVRLLDRGHVEVVERTARTLHVEVRSRSQPHLVRHVTAVDGVIVCDCPSYTHRHRCAHVDAAALIVAPPGLRRLRPAANATAGHLFDQGDST